MRIYAFPVAMPKAAPDLDYFAARAENQIWFSRKRRNVEAVSVSQCGYDFPNLNFGLSILASDSPHIFATASPR
jgi:hypothetical protein